MFPVDRTGGKVILAPCTGYLMRYPCESALAVFFVPLRTCRWGELQQDAVAAQCDDERLLPHAAALCLPGNGTLEHTRVLSWKERQKLKVTDNAASERTNSGQMFDFIGSLWGEAMKRDCLDLWMATNKAEPVKQSQKRALFCQNSAGAKDTGVVLNHTSDWMFQFCSTTERHILHRPCTAGTPCGGTVTTCLLRSI